MSLPGFTAEASLYSASNSYYVHGMYQRTEQKIYPADYVDQACFGGCYRNCADECAGSGKAACLKECAQDNKNCIEQCTRPGYPQPGPFCENQLGGCYPGPDGRDLSICRCGSIGECGPCFQLTISGYDLGMRTICHC